MPQRVIRGGYPVGPLDGDLTALVTSRHLLLTLCGVDQVWMFNPGPLVLRRGGS